jgi:hypothetical protein
VLVSAGCLADGLYLWSGVCLLVDVDMLHLARDLSGLLQADLTNIVNEARNSAVSKAQIWSLTYPSSCVCLGLQCDSGCSV